MQAFEKLLEELKNQTGLEFSYRPATDGEEKEDIFADERKGVTCFFFQAQGKQYLGSLYGCSPAEYNYAVLLKRLIEKDSIGKTLSREEYLRSILQGKQPIGEMKKYVERYSVPDGACFCVCLRVERNLPETVEVLLQAVSAPGDYLCTLDENRIAFLKFDEAERYPSASEFALFLAQSVFEEVGVHPLIGVGDTVKRFAEIGDSFRQAAFALRMSSAFRIKGEVHTYKEFLLVKMLEEIPLSKRQEYMNEYLTDESKELLENEDMLNTAEEFFLNSLNVSETARKLFMHRNTLMYRLDKIERTTGLDIRKFSDAVSFRVLTLLYQLRKEEKGE